MPAPFDPNELFKRIRSRGIMEWQDTINTNLRNAILALMTKSNDIITDVEVTSFKRVSLTGSQDNVNKIFTLSYSLKEGSEQVFLGGLFLANKDNCDYSITDDILEFTFAPQIDDFITIFGIKD